MPRPRPSRHERPRRPILAVATAVATLAMLGVLAYVLVGMDSVTKGFADARITASQTANGQRDLLVFHQSVQRLALGGDVADALLRRDLALQQLSTLHEKGGRDPEIAAMVRALRAIDLVALSRADPRKVPAIDRRLSAIDREFKARYDRGDQSFAALVTRAISARADAQRLLAALIALSLLLVAAWTVRYRRRFTGDLASARHAARATERRYQSLVLNSSDLTLLVDDGGRVLYASPSAEAVVGRRAGALAGRAILDLVADADHEAFAQALADATTNADRPPRLEFRDRSPEPDARHLEATLTNLLDEPDVGALVLNVRDVSDRHRLEAELAHLAFHDPLTGLANRALLHERISHAAARSLRHDRAGAALLLLDLDDFKAVNDSLGHDEGDRLLTTVASRLTASVRGGDTVARLGGDEFVVFLEDVADATAAAAFAAGLVARISAPVTVGAELMPIGVSIGVRFAAEPGFSPEDLLRDADLAMYSAKAARKGSWALFEPAMHDDAATTLSLRNDLHRATGAGELVLRYQPVVEIERERVKGFEALVRWQHPTLGLLGPDRFVALAEESGLIAEVGAWVMREALTAGARMHAATGRTDLTMAVNLSPRQLESPDITTMLQEALNASGFPARQVIVELTEGVLLQKTDLVMDRLEAIRAMGVRLALDDFGTGFSSLSYLERLPLDILKIDQSFVSALQAGSARTELVRTIVGLAQALRLRTVAEGVEDSAQLAALRGLGCDDAQGYLFAPPLSEDDALAAIARPEPFVRTGSGAR